MEVTLDLKELILFFVYAALFVLIIYLILLIKNLIVTLKKTNEVMDDAKVITAISAAKAKELDGAITEVTGAVSTITNAVKGNESVVKTIANIGKTLASVQGVINKFKTEDKDKKPEETKEKKHGRKAK